MDPLGQSRMMKQGLAVILCVFAVGELCSAQGQSTWPSEMNVGTLRFHADFSLQKYRQEFLQLAELHTQVSSILGLTPAAQETHVYLFRRKSTYRKYLNRYFPAVTDQRRAMFIQQSDVGMVFVHFGKQMMTDLRHEATHAILHSSLPMVPLWLDEGLAEYFEVDSRDRHSSNPHLKTIRKCGPFQAIASIGELEKIDDFSEMKSQHYRDAWAWVHFMLHGPDEARQVLKSYIRDIQQRVPPGEFVQRLESVIPNSEYRVQQHFFPEQTVSFSRQQVSRFPLLKNLKYTHKKTRKIRH